MSNFYGNILKHFQEAFSAFSFRNATDPNEESPSTAKNVDISAENTKGKVILSADRWFHFAEDGKENELDTIVSMTHSPADKNVDNDYGDLTTSAEDISDKGAEITLTSPYCDEKGHLNENTGSHTISININGEKTTREKADTHLQDQIGTITKDASQEEGKPLSDQTKNIRTTVSDHEERVKELETSIKGLSGAMHFEGALETLPGSTSGYEKGDVIIVKNKEYVSNGESWIELGDVTQERADINANAAAIKVINGNEKQKGSIKKAVNDLATGQVATNTKNINTNKLNITKNADAIEIINGNEATSGSIKKAVNDLAIGQVTTNANNISTINKGFSNITIITPNPDGSTTSMDFTNTHNQTYEAAKYFAQTLKYASDPEMLKTVKQNKVDIAEIKNPDTGILAQSKTYTDKAVQINTEAINKINGDGQGSIKKAVNDLATGQVKNNTDAIVVINGDGQGSIKKAVNELATGQVATNTKNINKNTEAISIINNPETGILAQSKQYTDTLTAKEGAITKNTVAIANNTSAIEKINNPTTGILATAQKYTDSKVINFTVVQDTIILGKPGMPGDGFILEISIGEKPKQKEGV